MIGLRAIALSLMLACAAGSIGCASSGSRGALVSPQAQTERTREALRLAERARHVERLGRDEEAAQLYAESLQLDPDLFVSLNNMGVLLMRREQYYDAVQLLSRAAELEPGDPRPVTNIALCWQRSMHDRDALRHFEQALERDRHWLPALRGSALSASRLRVVTRESLERAERGLLVESDPRWRELFLRERVRLETALEAGEGR